MITVYIYDGYTKKLIGEERRSTAIMSQGMLCGDPIFLNEKWYCVEPI